MGSPLFGVNISTIQNLPVFLLILAVILDIFVDTLVSIGADDNA